MEGTEGVGGQEIPMATCIADLAIAEMLQLEINR